MGQSLGSYKAPGLTKNISGPEEINILKTFSHKINVKNCHFWGTSLRNWTLNAGLVNV